MQNQLFNQPTYIRPAIEHNIHTDTVLIPYIIAGKVVYDSQATNKVRYSAIPDIKKAEILTALTNALCDRAEKCYQHSPVFCNALSNKKTDCREVLAMYMYHWLQSELKKLIK